MTKDATFSPCGKYRYQLSRIWDNDLPYAMCIGLNPSKAGSVDDDPTITHIIGLLTAKGYGGFYMTNLFALISPHPEDLRACPDPVKDNDHWLEDTYKKCDEVIFCWGNFKQAAYRAQKIALKYQHALCFGKNANGTPKHPLYLKKNTELVFYHK